MYPFPEILAVAFASLPGFRAPDGSTARADATLRVDEPESPAIQAAALPRFSSLASDGLVLSWIGEPESGDDGASVALRCARIVQGELQPAVQVASGSDWVVNWTDVPIVCSLGGELLVAAYLQGRPGSGHDYHVQLVRSEDGGASWSEPVRLHEHDGPGEHGFVSLVPLAEGACAAVWLDGRAMTKGGATALYMRRIERDGALGPERVLDERVCDCCPTAAVRTEDGALLVAYRDRSAEEVRDVSIIRVGSDGAAEPVWRSDDGWTIAGCPVNGPALAASGEQVAVIWFTLGNDARPRIEGAFSRDGGRSFPLRRVLVKAEALGRVDATFDAKGRPIVAWLQGAGELAEWRVARVDPLAGVLDGHLGVGTTNSRESGLGRLAREGDHLYFACTKVDGEEPRIELRRFAWE